jgi:hypothetical protein
MAPVEFEAQEDSLEAKPIMDGSGADSKPAVTQTSSLMVNHESIQIPQAGSNAGETDGVHRAGTRIDERLYDHPKLPDLKLPSRKSRISAALWKHLPKRSSKSRAPSCPSFRLLGRMPASKIAPAPNTKGAECAQTTSIVPFGQDDTKKVLEMKNVLTVAGMPVDADVPIRKAFGGTPAGNPKAKAIDYIL